MALLLCASALCAGCVVLPRTYDDYDEQCQVQSRHLELEIHQVASLGQCANQGCAAFLVAAGAVTAASAVVSGSIVLVGNIVYWFEKQSDCLR